nr:hypothetical protein [Mycoplasmopsis bovis]
MVLVILLQILTHKLKIYQTPPEDNIKEKKKMMTLNTYSEQLEEIQEWYMKKSKMKKWKINKKNSNYLDDLE